MCAAPPVTYDEGGSELYAEANAFSSSKLCKLLFLKMVPARRRAGDDPERAEVGTFRSKFSFESRGPR